MKKKAKILLGSLVLASTTSLIVGATTISIEQENLISYRNQKNDLKQEKIKLRGINLFDEKNKTWFSDASYNKLGLDVYSWKDNNKHEMREKRDSISFSKNNYFKSLENRFIGKYNSYSELFELKDLFSNKIRIKLNLDGVKFYHETNLTDPLESYFENHNIPFDGEDSWWKSSTNRTPIEYFNWDKDFKTRKEINYSGDLGEKTFEELSNINYVWRAYNRYYRNEWNAVPSHDRSSIYSEFQIVNGQMFLCIKMEAQDQWLLWNNNWVGTKLDIKRDDPITADATLPYTIHDLSIFTQFIEDVFSQTITINDATDPVIFETTPNENEIYVNKVFNSRINNFFSSKYISETLTQKIGYVNRDNVTISLEQNLNDIDKPGDLEKTKVRFSLNNNRKFVFGPDHNGGEPTNFIEFTVPIKIYLNPESDFKAQDLIQILPYTSSSNVYKEETVETEYNENENILSQSSSDNETINSFAFDINKPSQAGEVNRLISKEKFTAIRETGTKIDLELQLTRENKNLLKNNIKISFDRVFVDGRISQEIHINSVDFIDQNKAINFENNISLSMMLKGEEIIFFNDKLIKFKKTEPIQDPFQFTIVSAKASVPLEQYAVTSKWEQLIASTEAKPVPGSTSNENYYYGGKYKTLDPFIFKMKDVSVPIYDSETGELIKETSKYQPAILDGSTNENNRNTRNILYPSPDGTGFMANLGNYVMKMKNENGVANIKIQVNEYNIKTDAYDKLAFELEVIIDLLASQATFEIPNWSDNALIPEEEKIKYFDPENELTYRGDFISKETGMYKPRLVWVNALPPESFLYDPLDEEGKLLEGVESGNANYDVGYIAELNAPGFLDEDFSSLPTFGSYSTNFNKEEFVPNGIMPYSEYYTFNNNSIIPSIEKLPFSSTGQLNSKQDLRQVVLNKPGSNIYLYQFIKIPKEIKKNLLDVYGNLQGINNQNLFIDFWDTYQAQHLMSYMKENDLAGDDEEIKSLPYHQIIQYWSIYVNDPKHYSTNDQLVTKSYDISELNFEMEFSKIPTFNEMAEFVRKAIDTQLNEKLKKMGWIAESDQFILNIDYFIEDLGPKKTINKESEFDKKINLLLAQYNKPLSGDLEVVKFEFTIMRNNENEIIKISGTNNISFKNNKDIDKIVNFDNFSGKDLNINSEMDPYNKYNKITLIKNKIYEEIEIELQRILTSLNLYQDASSLPKEKIHYKLEFIAVVFNDKTHQYEEVKQTNLTEAVKRVLLYDVESEKFNNNLYIDVISINQDKNHFTRGKFRKLVNNSYKNDNKESIPPERMNDFKFGNVKMNSEHPDFVIENNDKIGTIKKKIEAEINQIILFNSRMRIELTNEVPYLNVDYEIKYVKGENEFFLNANEAIEQILLKDTNSENKEFNNTLKIEIKAIPVFAESTKLEGMFNLEINNSNLNEPWESENWDDPDDNLLDEGLDNDFNQGQSSTENANEIIWWIVTPIAIVALILVTGITIVKVRKGRKIR